MVELRETGNIMTDMARMISSGSPAANGSKMNSNMVSGSNKKPPELKATLYTWRERLPNKWDALKEWDDIFCWRTEVGVNARTTCGPWLNQSNTTACWAFFSRFFLLLGTCMY